MTNTIELLLSYSNEGSAVEIRGQEISSMPSNKTDKKKKVKKSQPKQISEDEIEEVIQFASKLGPCQQRKLYKTEDKGVFTDHKPTIYTAQIPIEEKKV